MNFSDFDEKSKDLVIKNMINRIFKLETKLNETIDTLNFVSLYYDGKGDYAGNVEKLEVE